MAKRRIYQVGEDVLRQVSKPVTEFDDKLSALMDDMIETLVIADGAGLAAPQVGVLRRIAVVDIGDGPIVLINPQIIAEEGEQTGDEACLSLPGKAGEVKRPNHVVVRALDENMTEYEMEADELLARAFCHEIEHLDGHMYMERVIGDIHDAQMDEE